MGGGIAGRRWKLATLLGSATVRSGGTTCHITIHPLLSSQAFDPETIDRMSAALKGVYETLSLKLADGPETRLMAQKIVELAQRGCVTLLRSEQWR